MTPDVTGTLATGGVRPEALAGIRAGLKRPTFMLSELAHVALSPFSPLNGAPFVEFVFASCRRRAGAGPRGPAGAARPGSPRGGIDDADDNIRFATANSGTPPTLTITAVPEPSLLGVAGMSALSLLARSRRRRSA